MLTAAAELIAERGLARTRIADVAERVGASPALVVYYFDTKENLLIAALRESETGFYAAAESLLRSQVSLRERIETSKFRCQSSVSAVAPARQPP